MPDIEKTKPPVTSFVKATLIITMGNVLTRLFGVARESVLAALFGTAGITAAFTLADNVLTIFFDLLVSGAISSALIPVLSNYAEPDKRAEFWQIVNTLLTLGLLFFVGVVLFLQIIAEPLAGFMAQGQSADIQVLTAQLIRLMIFGIIFLGVSSIMMATLQALQRFGWSALSLAGRNASVVVIALLFSQAGIWSIAGGVVLGTFMLIVLQAPGLRDLPLRPNFNWRHPAIREILRLYRPIFLGLIVTSGVLIVDRAIASTLGESSLGAMRFATTLQQFTLGLVGSAISIAILPTLSRQAAFTDLSAYRQTLTNCLKLLIVLIIPATIGLLALALPTISFVFERNKFDETSRGLTYLALLGYLPGIPAAAIDQLLIFAFYARKNTLTPVIVGVVANLAFLTVAFSLVSLFGLGMIGLVIANSFQQALHMVIMFVLLRNLFGKLGSNALWASLSKCLLASLLLGASAFLAAGLVNSIWGYGTWANFVAIMTGTAIGGMVYLAALYLLKVNEILQIWQILRAKLLKR